VALLHEGRLLALDRPGALRSALPGAVVEVIVADPRRGSELLERLPGVTSVQLFGERIHARLAEGHEVERLASALRAGGLTVESLRTVATSLEDVFIARLGGTTS
jgi:ABC-2 type transport system ATP-binding protein